MEDNRNSLAIRSNKVFRGINRGFDRILDGSGIFAIALMVLLTIFVCIYMFARYVSIANIPGFYDGSRYVLLVFPFVLAGYTMRSKKHITIDVLMDQMTEQGQNLLWAWNDLVSILLIGLLAKQQWSWLQTLIRTGTKTVAIWKMPQWIIVGVIFIGTILLLLQTFRSFCDNILRMIEQRDQKFMAKDLIITAVIVAGYVISLVLFHTGHTYIAMGLLAIIMLMSGAPVFIVLLGLGLIGIYYTVGVRGLIQVPITIYGQLNSFDLTCLPIYIFAGNIMGSGKLIDDLFDFIDGWIGGFTPSLLIAAIMTGALLSALTGSSTAATALLAGTAMPYLEKRGFKKSLICGIIAACGTGSLIPPSNGYIVYCVLTQTSISKMFIASYLPAFLLFALFILAIVVMYVVRPKSLFEGGIVRHRPPEEKKSFKQKLLLTWSALPTLLGPVLMFVFLYTGVLTATESAAFLLMYSIVVTLFIKRTLTVKGLFKACIAGVYNSAQLLCITAMAFIFSTVISQAGITASLIAWTQSVGMGYYGVLLFLFVILVVIGAFMPASSARIMTLPIFFPIAKAVGIDPLLLGVFYAITLEIGSFSPPFGMSLFVLRTYSKDSYVKGIKGVVPFLLMFLLCLVLIAVFPQITMILPNTMKG